MAELPTRPEHLARRLGAGVGRGRSGQSSDPVRRSLERFRNQVRRRAAVTTSETFFRGLSRLGRLHPLSRPERHQVEVIEDVPYTDSGRPEHVLDIYRPAVRPGPHPVVLYVHGGGFRLLSKDTHWIMGLVYARFGYLVFNISYRLAPEHPFPAALEDACDAYRWVVEHAERYGGDLSRLVVAGESAGANLVTALTAATTYRRPEPWAQQVFDTGVVPAAAVPSCGIFQVTDTDRFHSRKPMPVWVKFVLEDVEASYLRDVDRADRSALELADPLLLFEAGRAPDRSLPPFFLPVGTRDPLLPDTRRLAAALAGLGSAAEARYYQGEIHAFHAMIWRRAARRCWQDTFAFLDRALRRAPGQSVTDSDDDAAA